MKIRGYIKTVLILISIWFCFMSADRKASAEELTDGIVVSSVSGSALTYYVGGASASNLNDGLSSETKMYKTTITDYSKRSLYYNRKK